jgi:hypothetical protein
MEHTADLCITAPYPYLSLPVILGTLGGIGLVIGPAGLLYLNLKRHGKSVKVPCKGYYEMP